jgi:hypothetical protein
MGLCLVWCVCVCVCAPSIYDDMTLGLGFEGGGGEDGRKGGCKKPYSDV